MGEYDIAKKIRELIEASNGSSVEIVTKSFVDLWFRGKKFTDIDFTKKLIDFSNTYDFGHVIILNHRGVMEAIRFWEKEKIKLLENKEKEN
jgi:hypothetical protein